MIQPLDNYDEIIETSAPTMLDEPKLNPIPTDIILNKVITGWGATYAEITSNRNSIILLPHKSQINSKHDIHKSTDNTFPVTEKQKTPELVNHILASGTKKIKFLSTPEGLNKVIKAIKETGGDPYGDYFLLCDESHKLTKDIGYRVNISDPMNHFFKFKGKAMISATPFRPSDPRFESFKFVKVRHTRNVKKRIHLLCVNNLGAAFHEYLNNYNGHLLFVFYNTLNGIHALMKNGDLFNNANVYCSEDGVKEFKLKEFNNAYSKLIPEEVAKINFLTSSFFNGLDISNLTSVPDVVILTDIQYAHQTIIDPNTDAYQILGRFRQNNPFSEEGDRYNTATHIINIKNSASVKLEKNVIKEFELSQDRYRQILELQATATDDFLVNEVYGEALKRIKPYYNLLDESGNLDFFKFDNYLYEYRLKTCYGHPIAPGLSYAMSDLYDITEDKKIYLPEEFISMSKGMKRYSKENILMICEELQNNENLQGIDGVDLAYEEISKRFPLVVEAFKILGYQRIAELKFNKAAIEKELHKLDIQNKKVHHGMIEAVYSMFLVSASYQVNEVKEKLQLIFEEYGIKGTVKSTEIRTYFEVSEYTGHIPLLKRELKSLENDNPDEAGILEIDGIKTRSVRMYKILERKYNTINQYTTRIKHNLL